jgi:hypothetical protein
VLFISSRSNLKAFRSSASDSMCVQILILSWSRSLVALLLSEHAGEETEAKLRNFLRCELNIDYYIEFGNVHRFGSHQNNKNGTGIKPRPIVARILYMPV